MARTRKAQNQTRERLVLSDLAKVLSSNKPDSITRPHVGRKPDMHSQCPVCNSRRYLGKQLALSLDGSQHRAAVCEGCHAAVSLSGGYALTVSHRLAQHQHHKGACHAG